MTHDVQLSMRVPKELIERADALIPKLSKVPELSTWGRVSRAAVLRLVMLRGLEAIEAQVKLKKSG